MAPLHARRARARDPRDPRAVGFAAAVGLDVGPDEPATDRAGRTCRSCGTDGRLDMVDATAQRAFLTCPRCGRSWDTDRLDDFAEG